jgi:hypothetical protein
MIIRSPSPCERLLYLLKIGDYDLENMMSNCALMVLWSVCLDEIILPFLFPKNAYVPPR